MEDLWDILVPVMVIGGIFASVLTEKRKNIKKNMPTAQHLENIEAEQPVSPPQSYTHINNDTPKSKKTSPQARHRRKQDMPGDNTGHITTQEDKAYSQDVAGEADNAMDDIRRAMIAHEILKRKF